MKQGAPDTPRDPILVDGAYSFGVGVWQPGKRGKGILTLTEDALTFLPSGDRPPVEIPLTDISGLGTAARRAGDPKTNSVLRVTYRGNLVLGLAVEHPDRWVNAVQALSRQLGTQPTLDRPVVSRFEVRRFRVVAGIFLLLVILMSTALPLFFTWMQARVNKPAGEAATTTVLPEPAF